MGLVVFSVFTAQIMPRTMYMMFAMHELVRKCVITSSPQSGARVRARGIGEIL